MRLVMLVTFYNLPSEIHDEIYDAAWWALLVLTFDCAPNIMRIVRYGHPSAQLTNQYKFKESPRSLLQ